MFPSTRQRAQLILYPETILHISCSFSSPLFSPWRASASYCRLGFSSAERLRRRIVAFPFIPGRALPTELPPPTLLWPTALWATQNKKKKHNLYSEPCLRCKAGEGEEQALLKSPFEDGLKSSRIEPALREHLFTLPGFVLQDGGV